MKIKTRFNQIDKEGLYFIADIGANHDGSLSKALELINLCKESGAHAAKFQNFSASKIVSKYEFDNIPKSTHQANWHKSVFDVYKAASISSDWTPILKNECDKVGIDYFTSPYDFDAVNAADKYVDLYKIGSGDITWLEIIEYILKKDKPILLATGASDELDVQRVMKLIQSYNARHVLMQCNTNYTGNNENFKFINLNVIRRYAELYPDSILGLSDHTPGHSTVLGAITLGGTVIEKHFTDNNKNIGPDHFFAMNPSSWREMVDRSNELFLSLGDGVKRIENNEKQSHDVQRRSICVSRDYKKGTILSKEDLVCLRPYSKDGFHPFEINKILEKKLNVDLNKHQSLKRNYVV